MSTTSSRRRVLASMVSASVLFALNGTSAFALQDGADANLTDEQWKERLSQPAYLVLRRGGTERPFSSPLNREKRDGVYTCAGCSTKLFRSEMKYDSGTGWPSFYDTIPGSIRLVQTPRDRLLLQKEVRCERCDGHLGHVFEDGPRPTGLRYCMNGVALAFNPDAKKTAIECDSSAEEGVCAS